MNRYYSIFALLSLIMLFAQAEAKSLNPQSKLVAMDTEGKITYHPYTDRGDIIPDFSNCGYMGGGVALPNVLTVATISAPSGGDDTPIIQAIIDSVAQLPILKSGFRGAILLKKGRYKIGSTLVVNASGIVLRGEGANKKSGTVLLATTPQKYNVIEIGISAKMRPINASIRSITDQYVFSGSRVIHVKDADKTFAVGDNIVVHRPSTASWIGAIGMDSIPPRPLEGETTNDSFLRYRTYGSATNTNGTVQWKEGSKELLFERKIVEIDDSRIVLDIPIVNALQREFGGAKVYKYDFAQRIENCGVENLYGMVLYDDKIKANHKIAGEYQSDENHANNFIYCQAIENAWIKDVSVEHFDCCVWTTPMAKFITGEDLSSVNPISVITGGRRYAYSVWGQMCLFQRSYSSHHRHEFVLGPSVAGPNAFVDGSGDVTLASSEPHQRWAAGCLYDNITIKGYDGSLLAVNRSWYGSGHGWSGAQIVFWNCSAPTIMVMQPPTAQNFAIGYLGDKGEKWLNSSRSATVKAINGVSRRNFDHKGNALVGDGWIECNDTTVTPLSLYYSQLKERMGVEAVRAVTTLEQQQRYGLR